MEYPTLRQLFSSYFHQDWTHEGQSAAAIIARIVGDAEHDALLMAAAELRALLREKRSDDALASLVRDRLGCAYAPEASGKSMREWLEEVVRRFELV